MTDIEVRIDKLEQRVLAIEKIAQIRGLLIVDQLARKEETLIYKYGEYVDKSTAARILGVTRATVYAMLADGRIKGACSGRRVDVRSIARHLCAENKGGRQHENSESRH